MNEQHDVHAIGDRTLRSSADAPVARQAAGVRGGENPTLTLMRNLVQQLIAEERRVALDSDSKSRAAFRICEKLRAPLCTLAGVAGFRSLLSRALVLAKPGAPLLAGVQIKADGTFQYSPDLEQQLASTDAAKAGAALADELIGLLITFIGEALTLRLVHEVWPQLVLKDPKSAGK